MLNLRRKEIADIITEKGMVSVSDLATKFDKSEMTIHRDLTYLEQQGILTKKRGGAVANSYSDDVNYSNRSKSCLKEKQQIANSVYDLIEDGDTIMIDGSTTSIEVAKKLKSGKRITVFTHSPLIIYELKDAKDVVLYSVGSFYSREMVHFVGTDVEEMVSSLNFSKCIFGVSAITNQLTLADPYIQLALVKERMIESSVVSIVVADSTKFGKIAVKNITNIENIDYIVTDSKLTDTYKNELQGKVNLINSK